MLDIEQYAGAIENLCRRLRVRRLDLFGSATTGRFGAESDVDVVVTFEDDGTDMFDRYFELKESLEELFGREVDVVSEAAIKNPYFREGLDRTRRSVYAA